MNFHHRRKCLSELSGIWTCKHIAQSRNPLGHHSALQPVLLKDCTVSPISFSMMFFFVSALQPVSLKDCTVSPVCFSMTCSPARVCKTVSHPSTLQPVSLEAPHFYPPVFFRQDWVEKNNINLTKTKQNPEKRGNKSMQLQQPGPSDESARSHCTPCTVKVIIQCLQI